MQDWAIEHDGALPSHPTETACWMKHGQRCHGAPAAVRLILPEHAARELGAHHPRRAGAHDDGREEGQDQGSHRALAGHRREPLLAAWVCKTYRPKVRFRVRSA